MFCYHGVLQAHFNYNSILVLKEITLKMVRCVTETCWSP